MPLAALAAASLLAAFCLAVVVPAGTATAVLDSHRPSAFSARSVSTLTVTSSPTPADDDAPVTVALLDPEGAPVAGAAVLVERLTDGMWQPLTTVVTDVAGRAAVALRVSREPADNVIRASYAGDAQRPPASSPETVVELVPRASRLTLQAPRRVIDDYELGVSVRWRTRQGDPVSGDVRIQQRERQRWRTIAVVTTDADGAATAQLRPRTDVVLRARAASLPWVERASSERRRVDNVPPAKPVALPGAPRPRLRLPPQPRATSAGPAATVSPISDAVWRSMVGRSWHPGCPVGREGLRLLRINYYGFDGYRHRGELVVAASAAGQVVGALSEMHARRLPIRSLYRVDRFGWSPRLRGADDLRSMAADNTSAFNCRDVVGRPGVRSPHSWGRSLDLNPWENPYRVNGQWLPNGWWASRSHPRVAWRGGGHVVLAIMRRYGFAWTYGTADAHHFDARTADGRVLVRCSTVCH